LFLINCLGTWEHWERCFESFCCQGNFLNLSGNIGNVFLKVFSEKKVFGSFGSAIPGKNKKIFLKNRVDRKQSARQKESNARSIQAFTWAAV
jgi:hypothetical protein